MNLKNIMKRKKKKKNPSTSMTQSPSPLLLDISNSSPQTTLMQSRTMVKRRTHIISLIILITRNKRISTRRKERKRRKREKKRKRIGSMERVMVPIQALLIQARILMMITKSVTTNGTKPFCFSKDYK
jgi:hypothetical protein